MPQTLMKPPARRNFKERKTKTVFFPYLIGLSVCASLALFAAVFIPDDKTEAEYQDSLIERKEAGEFLASGEEKDFCLLMATLKDSIVLDCLPVLEGINWERPPKSPEGLGPDWIEVTHEKEKKSGNRRVFRHLKYPKIRVAFDRANPAAASHKGLKAFALRDHWQRFNPNATSKRFDAYLDKNNNPVADGHKDSHITL